MRDLRSAGRLAAQINGAIIGAKRPVAASVQFLTSRSAQLATNGDLWGLVGAFMRKDPKDSVARGFNHHLDVVRNELARRLWAQGLNISLVLLDEFLFDSVASGDPDPVLSVLRISASSRKKPDLVIFPLHSFGVMAAGLLGPTRKAPYTLRRAEIETIQYRRTYTAWRWGLYRRW